MKEKTIYVAYDGRRFDLEDACVQYEKDFDTTRGMSPGAVEAVMKPRQDAVKPLGGDFLFRGKAVEELSHMEEVEQRSAGKPWDAYDEGEQQGDGRNDES